MLMPNGPIWRSTFPDVELTPGLVDHECSRRSTCG